MRKTTKALLGSLFAMAMIFSSAGAASAKENWQCVPFARMISGIQIFGDAWTWWGQASSAQYPTGFSPTMGAVLVFKPQGAMRLGHVAVVSKVVTDRVIQITHANWSVIEGHRGQVEENVTVVDVSPAHDWSQVRVWYDPSRDFGATVYSTYGFIYQKPGGNENMVMAAARNATETALNQVSSFLPLTNPSQAMASAAQSTDRIADLIGQALSGEPKK